MSTVPIFAPDGRPGDIPAEQLMAAIKAGAKPGVNIIAPNGQPGTVPADRYVDAAKAGAKIVPFQDQEVKHPGFWASLRDDLKSMIPTGFNDMTNAEEDAADKAASDFRKQSGYSSVYRAAAPVAQAIGVNVPGMERSAQQGDVAGVAGHAAAVPAVMAATKGLVEGAPAAVKAAAPVVRSAVETVAPVASAVAERLPEIAGGAAGAYLGHATGIPEGGLIGAIGGRQLAKSIAEKFRSTPLDATAENTAYAGETSPRTVVTDPATGRQEFSDVVTAKQTVPMPKPAEVQQALETALGGKPLQPGVTLRNQPAAQAAAGKLPEGFTPVDSSVLKGYKYDPAAQEFTAITNNGQSYTHGDVSPSQAAAVESADSKGRAWTTAIRNSSPLVKKNGMPVKTATMGTATGEVIPKAQAGMQDLTDILQQSLDAARAGKTQ